MKWFLLVAALAAVAVAVEELPSATECDEEACQLPDCSCSSTDIPGGLTPRNTPQFVSLTFDDGVNIMNIETYRRLLYGRRNFDGCPAGTTFYVSHEYTNYQLVNELYNQGYEIALHSISHRTPQDWWAWARYEEIAQEIGDQKAQMAHFANIPATEVKGVRLPFLQMSGNTSFQVMKDYDLLFDHSWPTMQHRSPGLWPYTLDYQSIQDCIIPPCPTASIPGTWVFPMVTWIDPNGFPCNMVDACANFPDRNDENAWYQFIMENFERHYFNNRAPFGFYVHEWYLASNPAIYNAVRRFLDTINNLSDVFMVNASEVIDWVKNPVPVNEYRSRACRSFTATICQPSSCQIVSEHNANTYWLQICNICPANYPWVGNPLGE